jgi:hypothetical protein
MPAADCRDRRYRLSPTLERRPETPGLGGFAGGPAAPIRALGTRWRDAVAQPFRSQPPAPCCQ